MSIFDPINDNSPVVLTVPGLHGSGPDHWQTRWEVVRPNTFRVELGMWDSPLRNVWSSRLEQVVLRARGKVILAAHSLGCIAVAWWARMADPAVLAKVGGALLVAPADTEREPLLRDFAPIPRMALPFRSMLVASRNDPWMGFAAASQLADHWGSTLVDMGELGHINADSGLGSWAEGQEMLDRLILSATPVRRVAIPTPRPASDPEGFGLGSG